LNEDVEDICDLVDALAHWVAELRVRNNRLEEIKRQDAEFEMPLADELQPSAPKVNAEYSTAE
jgi:hypothetical protein